MIQNQDFLAAILADPDDDRPRLFYADWLERHGQPDRARLIRVQIELAHSPANPDLVKALQAEEEQLEVALEKTLPQLDGISWGSFQRGLVRTVYAADPAAFHRHAGEIATVGSVSRASFEKPDGFAILGESPVFARFTDLQVRNDDDFRARNGDPEHPFNAELQEVLASDHCPRLRSLELMMCQVGPRGAKALAECPKLGSLIVLRLDDNYIGDLGLAAIAASPYLAALRKLQIDLNDLGPDGVQALANSATVVGLEELILGDAIGPSAGMALGRSPYRTDFGQGRARDEIGASGAAILAQAQNLAGLTYLDMRSDIGVEGGRALAASPYLRDLRSLLLPGGWIGDKGVESLARSPVAANLEYLDVPYNDLTDKGAYALAASPYLGCLKPGGLDMTSNNGITEAGWRALVARFGDALDRSSIPT